MNVNALLNSAVKVGRKWAPIVLLAAGTVLAVDAIVETPECYEESNEIIVQEERAKGAELEPVEKVKATWQAWMPVIWREGASIACFYAAFYMKHKRGAAIAAAYTLLERERDELDLALREKLGKNKYEAVRHEMMDQKIEHGLKSVRSEDIEVGPDEALGIYYEPVTGKIFKADPRNVKKVIEDLDKLYLLEGFVPLSTFFNKLGIKSPDVGDYVGWQYDEGSEQHITCKTYDYHWKEKDLHITGLDMGLKLDKFVRTWW